MNAIDYLIARLKEDGTIRSLAILAVSLRQGFNSPEAYEAAFWAFLGLLSAYSALKPAAKPAAPTPEPPK